MRFTVDPKDHNAAVEAVYAGVPARSRLPILATIRIDAEASGRLRYSATDLDTTIVVRAQADVHESGTICLPAKKLKAIGDTVSVKGALHVEVEGERASLKFGKNGRPTFHVMGMDADSWPPIPPVDPARRFRMPATELTGLIRGTVFACSEEDTRPALQPLLWEIEPGAMRMVGCDGHRLAIAERRGAPEGALPGPYLLPTAAAQLVSRVVAGAEWVDVVLDERRAAFAIAGVQVFTALREGPYPDYRQVLPRTSEREVRTGRAALAQALDEVALLANQSRRVCLHFQEGVTQLWTEGNELGSSRNEIAAELEGAPLRYDVDARYLAELLKYIPTERVSISLGGSKSPAVLRAVPAEPGEGAPAPSGSALLATLLMMPLRIAETG